MNNKIALHVFIVRRSLALFLHVKSIILASALVALTPSLGLNIEYRIAELNKN